MFSARSVGVADADRRDGSARVRYGYRNVRALLNRERLDCWKHLVYRLYRDVGFCLEKRPRCERKGVRCGWSEGQADRENIYFRNNILAM
jgi:hypothetical protein